MRHFWLILVALACTGCIVWAPVNLGRPGGPAGLHEVVLRRSPGFFSPGKVLVVPIEGTIDSESRDGLLGVSRNTVADVLAQLEAARNDDAVAAVVLRIDSPGGTVTGADLVHREIRRFREDTGTPVIACLMDTAASGAYYVAVAADQIWALPTTITGSIGVITHFLEVQGLLELLGMEQRTIKSGALKDIGSPYRDMADEERRLLEELVGAMHARFVDVVDAGRPGLERQQVEALADGRPFRADEALELGLIDRIGYVDEAIAEAARRGGLDGEPDVVTFRVGWGEPGNVYASLGAAAPSLPSPGLDPSRWLQRLAPRLYYLWLPGG